MSKRITITLTQTEHDALEYTAQQERRTVRDMAAYLVVKHSQQRPSVTDMLRKAQGQPWHPGLATWNGNFSAANGASISLASGTQPPPLRTDDA